MQRSDANPNQRLRWSRRTRDFDLLLTDMVMPGGMTGLELIEILRKQTADLKVILCSGYDPGLEAEDLARRKQAFLQKPWTA
jgi:CheY-like chemotaxis protein